MAVDPELILFEAKTMDEHLALMLFPLRMAALLLGAFGALALTLAAIGVYGAVSHAVARRARELGIRLSLGAAPRDVAILGLGVGMRPVLAGGGVGVLLAAALAPVVAGLLIGVSPLDPTTFAVVPLALVAVALVAAAVPATRASRALPSEVLRRG